MSTLVTFNGTNYSIPAATEVNWQSLSSFLIAVAGYAATNSSFKQSVRIATENPVPVSAVSDFSILTNFTASEDPAIALPLGVDGMVYLIKDAKGDATAYPITITPYGTDTINGAATFAMNQTNQCVMIQFSDGNWVTVLDTGVIASYDTKAKITSLSPRLGALYFATDEGIMYIDEGSAGVGRLRAIALQDGTYYAQWNSSISYASGFVAGDSSGNLYRSLVSGNLNNALTDTTKWTPLQYRIPQYSAAVNYGISDLVSNSSGVLYKSIAANNLGNVLTSGTKWEPFALDISEYNANISYVGGQLARTNDGLGIYAAMAGTKGVNPNSDATKWWPRVLGPTSATGPTATLDCQIANLFSVTAGAGGNKTFTIDNMHSGMTINVYVYGAAGNTVTWTLANARAEDNGALTQRTGITYSNTMTSAESMFTLTRIGTLCVINSLHGIS